MSEKQNKKPTTTLVRFADLGFRMAIMIAIGSYGGHWLDTHFALSTPIFTIIGALGSIGGAIYSIIKAVQ